MYYINVEFFYLDLAGCRCHTSWSSCFPQIQSRRAMPARSVSMRPLCRPCQPTPVACEGRPRSETLRIPCQRSCFSGLQYHWPPIASSPATPCSFGALPRPPPAGSTFSRPDDSRRSRAPWETSRRKRAGRASSPWVPAQHVRLRKDRGWAPSLPTLHPPKASSSPPVPRRQLQIASRNPSGSPVHAQRAPLPLPSHTKRLQNFIYGQNYEQNMQMSGEGRGKVKRTGYLEGGRIIQLKMSPKRKRAPFPLPNHTKTLPRNNFYRIETTVSCYRWR